MTGTGSPDRVLPSASVVPVALASAAAPDPALAGPGVWMGRRRAAPRWLVLAPTRGPLPAAAERWMAAGAAVVVRHADADAVMAESLRSRPALLVIDARGAGREEGLAACRRLKADAFTGVVPVVAAVDTVGDLAAALAAGADDGLLAQATDVEWAARLGAALVRSQRDQAVHPTTRLPGTPAIERELAERLARGEAFGACYADLDHFKEYNDRYGYTEGDRVIRMVALILHDAVAGVAGEAGFVGHIGGDDFFLVLPLGATVEACDVIVETFDTLVPYQYAEADRRVGYYFGKDRRGQLHRVPLMTLSIGVVTTERRRLTHPEQVSRLASEMKTYAKGQAGSLYAVDRRSDDPGAPT